MTTSIEELLIEQMKQFDGRICDSSLFLEIEKTLRDHLPAPIYAGHLTLGGDYQILWKDENEIKSFTHKIKIPLVTQEGIDKLVKENK